MAVKTKCWEMLSSNSGADYKSTVFKPKLEATWKDGIWMTKDGLKSKCLFWPKNHRLLSRQI